MNLAMEIRKEKKNNLIYKATCFAGDISKVLKPMCAVVIGSVARGDFNDASDIDVVLISEKMPDVYKKRLELLYDYVFDAIEPKGYNLEEFILMYKKRNPIAIEAVEKGIIVYDEGVWNKVLDGIDALRK